MASLFRSLYGIPGLASRMDVLSLGRRDFQTSFSNLKYVNERLISSLRKFYGRYGDLIKQYEVSLSQNVKCHSVTRPYTMIIPY